MASPRRRLFSGWAPPIMRDRPLPTRRHLGLPGTGSRPRTSRPRATSSSSSMGHHIGFLHSGRERQALLGHRHLSARRRKLPRGPLSPPAPERRGHPSLYCEWTSTEARREAANAGKHDRVHEIFSSTGRTVRPRKVVRHHRRLSHSPAARSAVPVAAPRASRSGTPGPDGGEAAGLDEARSPRRGRPAGPRGSRCFGRRPCRRAPGPPAQTRGRSRGRNR